MADTKSVGPGHLAGLVEIDLGVYHRVLVGASTPRRHHHRVETRAARLEHHDPAGILQNRDQLIGRAIPIEVEDRTHVGECGCCVGCTGSQFALNVLAGQPRTGQHLRVVGVHDHSDCAVSQVCVVAARIGHDGRDHVQQMARRFGVVRIAGEERRMRCFGTDDDRSTVIFGVAICGVQRRERAVLGVFREAVGELARMTVQRHVRHARPSTTDVHHRQPQCSADGGVGPVARTERPESRRHLSALVPSGSAHHDERRGAVRGALHLGEVELGLAHRPDGGDHNGNVIGKATGHHRGGGYLLD